MCLAEANPGVPRRFYSLQDAAAVNPSRLHLAIGMFDGVHLGHQAVIEAAVRSARREGAVAAVLTFRPHPSRIFRPQDPTRLIMTAEDQSLLLADLGVNWIIQQPFTLEFAVIEAEEFVAYLKQTLSSLQALYVGRNFRFGRGRRGDVHMLVRSARERDIHVYSAPRVNLDGQPVSSTRIRNALADGDISLANTLLGYTYRTRAAVVPGKKLGRSLGFPTLNIPHNPELPPRFGVYAVRLKVTGMNDTLPGVANYGVRPTVEHAPAAPLLEVHLLQSPDFAADIEVEVEWLAFIRPEQRFPSLAALRSQIERDVDAARQFFQTAVPESPK